MQQVIMFVKNKTSILPRMSGENVEQSKTYIFVQKIIIFYPWKVYPVLHKKMTFYSDNDSVCFVVWIFTNC